MKLSRAIDWHFLEERLGAVYTDKPGHPPLPTRLMAGLAILKHMHDLSDEALCDFRLLLRWLRLLLLKILMTLAAPAQFRFV